MPLNAEQQELLDIQNRYKTFAETVRKNFGAVVVSRFSQSCEPVKSFLRLTPETKSGICQALVNRWIAAHAADGSLWNEIYTQVGNIQCLKIQEMKDLLYEFRQGIGKTDVSMGPYQKLNSEVYLMRRGVIPRMAVKSGHRMFEEGYSRDGKNAITADPALGQKIIAALPAVQAFGRGNGTYAMISIKSGGGGHVMAAYLGGGGGTTSKYPYSDVGFFDPNYGEYWFDSGKKFGDFLTWFIGQRCYKTYGGFQIRSFGVAAKHMSAHR